jgi:hypothetical protein
LFRKPSTDMTSGSPSVVQAVSGLGGTQPGKAGPAELLGQGGDATVASQPGGNSYQLQDSLQILQVSEGEGKEEEGRREGGRAFSPLHVGGQPPSVLLPFSK